MQYSSPEQQDSPPSPGRRPTPERTGQFGLWQVALIVLLAVIGTAVVTRALSGAGSAGPTPTPALAAQMPGGTPAAPGMEAKGANLPAPSATPSRTPSPTPTATPTPTPSPTPITVIDKVQALGRLETTRYSMQTAVAMTSTTDLNLPIELPPELTQQRMLLIASGDVYAGFDLSKIEPSDIHVQGTRVQMILPPAEILVTAIDNQATYVYMNQKPFYLPNDKTLEGKARQAAEDQLRTYALQHDILSQAEENGKYRLEAFLRSLGFTQVDLQIASEPAAGQ
jgi:hypothetical protein